LEAAALEAEALEAEAFGADLVGVAAMSFLKTWIVVKLAVN
jgi:hypothetical protein